MMTKKQTPSGEILIKLRFLCDLCIANYLKNEHR